MFDDSLRSRLIYRTLDAALTASLRPRRRLRSNLHAVVSPRSSNYDRVGAMVNALDAVFPGTARRATKLICRPMVVPFDGDVTALEPLDYGSGATVFLAPGAGGRAARVVKVYRRSLGAGAARLATLLAEYRRQHDQVRGLYRDVPGLLPETEYAIARSPILGRDAVVAVQEHVGEPIRDFREVTCDDVVAADRAGSGLARQIVAFAGPTLKLYRSQRKVPDLLGVNNLAVCGAGRAARLRLIDFRIFDLGPGGDRTRAVRERISRCIEQIERLAGALAPLCCTNSMEGEG